MRILAGVLCALLISPAVSGQAPDARARDEAAVRDLVRRYVDARERRQASEIEALFAMRAKDLDLGDGDDLVAEDVTPVVVRFLVLRSDRELLEGEILGDGGVHVGEGLEDGRTEGLKDGRRKLGVRWGDLRPEDVIG